MTEQQRHDDVTPETDQDAESDPALDDTTGNDWADEGGATPDGPATATSDG
ncbi:hypothetical protein ABFT23_02690 [Nocardioides sp. C4-1]|uniref:hypothetical protein n=1 Tax=Nocardioides sp. C4-1 TaxID=3151851 RepID=UPI003264351C